MSEGKFETCRSFIHIKNQCAWAPNNEECPNWVMETFPVVTKEDCKDCPAWSPRVVLPVPHD